MEHRDIKFDKLSMRIVEQAYASAQILTEEQKRKLIQDKFERASHLYEAQKKIPVS
jgi:Spy/CpxP family protein refolding chaperone